MSLSLKKEEFVGLEFSSAFPWTPEKGFIRERRGSSQSLSFAVSQSRRFYSSLRIQELKESEALGKALRNQSQTSLNPNPGVSKGHTEILPC